MYEFCSISGFDELSKKGKDEPSVFTRLFGKELSWVDNGYDEEWRVSQNSPGLSK